MATFYQCKACKSFAIPQEDVKYCIHCNKKFSTIMAWHEYEDFEEFMAGLKEWVIDNA